MWCDLSHLTDTEVRSLEIITKDRGQLTRYITRITAPGDQSPMSEQTSAGAASLSRQN